MHYIDDAIDYFKNLCVQHPQLLHDDDAGGRVFDVRDLDGAFGALRTGMKEKSYSVRLVLPTMEYRHEVGNNARKAYQMGLMVAKYHGRRDMLDSDVIGAIADAEKVADEFLERMISDSRNGYDLFRYSIDQIDNLKPTAEVVLNLFDGSYSGVFVMFEFWVWRKTNSVSTGDCDAVAWEDGGLTPL